MTEDQNHKKPSSMADKNTPRDQILSSQRGIQILTDRNILSLLKMPVLEVIYERFTHRIHEAFGILLNSHFTITSSSPYFIKFGEYARKINQPYMTAVLTAPELYGNCFLYIQSALMHHFIEMLLGGQISNSKKTLERKLTTIDIEILKRVVSLIVQNINESFMQVFSLHLQTTKIEFENSPATSIKDDEMINVLQIHFNFSEVSSYFDLILPYNSIEPLKRLLSQPYIGNASQNPQWSEHLEKEMRNIKVQLKLIIDGSVSKIHELLNLKIGNTIILNKSAEDPLEVSVNGTKVSLGKLGQSGNKIAVQLIEDIHLMGFDNNI